MNSKQATFQVEIQATEYKKWERETESKPAERGQEQWILPRIMLVIAINLPNFTFTTKPHAQLIVVLYKEIIFGPAWFIFLILGNHQVPK